MRDGRGEVIPVDISGPEPVRIVVDCGAYLQLGVGKGRYRRCALGHVHCTRCYRQAHRHRNNWTCGKCPGSR